MAEEKRRIKRQAVSEQTRNGTHRAAVNPGRTTDKSGSVGEHKRGTHKGGTRISADN
jgi:hypothetical protein